MPIASQPSNLTNLNSLTGWQKKIVLVLVDGQWQAAFDSAPGQPSVTARDLLSIARVLKVGQRVVAHQARQRERMRQKPLEQQRKREVDQALASYVPPSNVRAD